VGGEPGRTRAAMTELQSDVEKRVSRLRRAEGERRSVWAQAAALGALGVSMVLPVVVGAYAGRWLDARQAGYSSTWTVSLIILGLAVGIYNASRYLQRR
jgi:ATP synthase protein I